MYFKQFYLGCLAQASYMIADEETGTAALVDPRRDISEYLEEARSHGFRIEHVILTHFHADFVSGHLELSQATGATIYLGAAAEAEYEFQRLADGDAIRFGAVSLEILETPGHTPESISVVVYDLSSSQEKPYAVLTGDTLFIGDVGRPDLMASLGISARELAGMLYDSLHGKLLKLPDDTLVYPAHGAGSMCGKNLSSERVSTIGEQRRLNYALGPMSKDEFISLVASDQPDAPPYFAYDAMLNRRKRPTLAEALEKELMPLDVEQVLALREEGAQILDARDPSEFVSGYLEGSINIGLGGQYATWCGTILAGDRPIVVVAPQGREEEACMRLGRIGFDNVAGYLAGGMAALKGHPGLVRTAARVTTEELARQMSSGDPPVILDVRSQAEWNGKHIAGSINVPLHKLQERLGDVPRGRKMVIHCAGGFRSSIAASILRREGVVDAPDLIGGIGAWEKAGQEVVAPVALGRS